MCRRPCGLGNVCIDVEAVSKSVHLKVAESGKGVMGNKTEKHKSGQTEEAPKFWAVYLPCALVERTHGYFESLEGVNEKGHLHHRQGSPFGSRA